MMDTLGQASYHSHKEEGQIGSVLWKPLKGLRWHGPQSHQPVIKAEPSLRVCPSFLFLKAPSLSPKGITLEWQVSAPIAVGFPEAV